MSIKLFNFSGMDNNLVMKVLLKAKELANCPGDVVVKITRGSRRGVSGLAQKCKQIPYGWLPTKVMHFSETISTDGGIFSISPGISYHFAIECATNFLSVAIHEFHHVKEYQMRDEGISLSWSKPSPHSGRRIWHDNRPEEIRANRAADRAMAEYGEDKDIQELILDLALEIEKKANKLG